jgi:hypothetical protein
MKFSILLFLVAALGSSEMLVSSHWNDDEHSPSNEVEKAEQQEKLGNLRGSSLERDLTSVDSISVSTDAGESVDTISDSPDRGSSLERDLTSVDSISVSTDAGESDLSIDSISVSTESVDSD